MVTFSSQNFADDASHYTLLGTAHFRFEVLVEAMAKMAFSSVLKLLLSLDKIFFLSPKNRCTFKIVKKISQLSLTMCLHSQSPRLIPLTVNMFESLLKM